MGVAKGVVTTSAIIGAAFIFTPLFPVGIGLLAGSGVGGLATFAGDTIAAHVKDTLLRDALEREISLAS